MLMMRLQRVGRKNNPAYRIVVIDKRASTKSSNVTDLLGTYDPKAGLVVIDETKAKHWLAHGVQPSDTVYNMLVTKKIIDGKKRNALSRKSPIIDEAKLKAEAEAKAAAEAKEAEAEETAAADAPADSGADEAAAGEAETSSDETAADKEVAA